MYLMKLRTYERRLIERIVLQTCIFLLILLQTGMAQPNLSFEIKKPKKYESRSLPSEKSASSNFPAPKRFYNNTVSRFNYFFNANTIMNGIIDSAKGLYKEDYTQLLTFYNYSLDQTANGEIDTIIYKCTAGILLHDLRSDWVDKLYLLMGKAFLYRKDFDSASNVFQYINYAFAPKDNGYDIPIGSNASNTKGIFTIATRENPSLWKKLMSFPPSRNDSYLLQVRTYIEQDLLVEASSLLELVRTDPNFPPRLQKDMEEMYAYMLYKQKSYGPAADHLLKALGNQETKFETARWEYLAGQMYQLAGKDSLAILLFNRSILHTNDPLMEVYARLNVVSMAAGRQENALQKNLDELLKMAKKDKYEIHRDIIYYAAAELELKRKNYTAAQDHLLKSIKYNVDNPEQREKSFLLLGDLNYNRKKYSFSHQYYDSIQVALIAEKDQQRVNERKPALKIISENEASINREDSLQKVSEMPEAERTAYLSKLLKQMRKELGLKDSPDQPLSFGNTLAAGNNVIAQQDMFSSGMKEFYFQNTSIKAKGLSDFRSAWGNRPNVDNWRRQSAVNSSLQTISANAPQDKTAISAAASKEEKAKELTLASLEKDIPLSIPQKDSSNRSIMEALLGNANVFQNQLEDFPSAIEMYEELMRRFPESAEVEQSLYNLVYCYRKNGQLEKSDSIANQLKNSYPSGKMTTQLKKAAKPKLEKKNDPVEKQYENIYGMFLAGRFDEAKEAKLLADKQYGNTYWTPQLLYIESIYYIKQKDDTTAIQKLQSIEQLFANTPLADKATTMIDVLQRRSQIESYLTNLTIEKPEELTERRVDLYSTNTLAAANLTVLDSAKTPKKLELVKKELIDITDTKTISTAAVIKKEPLSQIPKLPLQKVQLENTVFGQPVNDNNYVFNAADTQYVVVVLDKVDPIFITEGRNAFNRYNQETYSGQNLTISTRKINNQFQFLMVGPFVNAQGAMNYIDRTRPLAKSRIIPWLTADKYSFMMISNFNMNILLKKDDVDGYHTFIQQVFPDKF